MIAITTIEDLTKDIDNESSIMDNTYDIWVGYYDYSAESLYNKMDLIRDIRKSKIKNLFD
jgi:hypothetical protein